MGSKCPAFASMHPCNQGVEQLASGSCTQDCVRFRGHSMPWHQLSRPISNNETAHCSVSLGPIPVDRTDVMPPANRHSAHIAATNRVHGPDGVSQGAQGNPFASFEA